ncbi:MAG: hypothetical protein LC777_08500, partial [Actinobacteria bacterium]|nr:hypothetical protein [Actinomycetota bacterium]
ASGFCRRHRSMRSGSACCVARARSARPPTAPAWTARRLMKLRLVAKQGALDALAASRPGVKAGGVDPELAEARAEIARLSEALKEMGVRLMLAEGKGRWD